MLRFYTALISVLILMTACVQLDSETDYLAELEGAVIDPPRVLEDFSVIWDDFV